VKIRRRSRNWLVFAALMFATGTAGALADSSNDDKASHPGQSVKVSGLPDWHGTWRLVGSPGLISDPNAPIFVKGVRNSAPLRPEWKQRYDDDVLREESQGDASTTALVDTHTIYCLAGMPRVIATPFDYTFFVGPQTVTIVIGGEVRTIYTDGRSFPAVDMMWPKIYGWSTGHWEGQTLVIETRDMRPELWLDTTPLMLSDQAVVQERLKLVAMGVIENKVTITDPVKFNGPWSFTRQYKRETDNKVWLEEKESCGMAGDRNPIVNGNVTVKLPNP